MDVFCVYYGLKSYILDEVNDLWIAGRKRWDNNLLIALQRLRNYCVLIRFTTMQQNSKNEKNEEI
jgi:hypothetical protein